MKKFVSLVLAAALSASFLGCAGETKPTPVTPQVETPADAPKTEPTATPDAATPAPDGEKK